MEIQKIRGLIVPTYTPLNKEGKINLDLIPKYIEWLATQNIEGVFVNGSSGESLSISTAERMKLQAKWAECAPSNLKIIVHVGHTNIEEAKQLAKHAQDIGVFAISTMAPTFFKPASVEGLVEYCKEISDAAPNTPFYFYHIPARTGVSYPMANFLNIADREIPNLAGIKFTNADFLDLNYCLQFHDQKYDILFGADEAFSAAYMCGVRGFIGTSFNVYPFLFHQVLKAFEENNVKEAQRLVRISLNIIREMLNSGNFLGMTKGLMKMHGFDCGPLRLPLQSISDNETDAIIQFMETQGLDFEKSEVKKGRN